MAKNNCVDCSSHSAGYYSYKYKVNLCKSCSEVHGSQLIPGNSHCRSLDCLLNLPGKEEHFPSNKELELFLPDFYQKLAQNTPKVIRKEFIAAKYVDKLFSSPYGVNTLMPPTKVGILLKKRSVHSGWRPCYVKLDKRKNVLEYFSYKCCKMTPKFSIEMKSVEIFIERIPREKSVRSEEGEFYLHIIWITKSEKIVRKPSFAKITVFSKQKVIPLKEARKDEESDVRNLYFWPTTDRECFEWYFALLSAKFALLNTNTLKAFRYSSTPLLLSNSATSSNTYAQIDGAANNKPHENTLVPITDSKPECMEMSPPKQRMLSLSDIDPFCHFPDAPTAEFVRRSTIIPKANLLEISGLCTANEKESNPFFVSCKESEFSLLAVTHEDEIESDSHSGPPKSELFLDSSFYSCPPKQDTNPFNESTRNDDKRADGALPAQSPTANAKSSPFKQKTSIYDDPIYELGSDNPVFGEDSNPIANFQVSEKDSWINGAVRVSETQTNRLTSVDSCPLNLDIQEAEECSVGQDRVFDPGMDSKGLYGSIREDMTLNRNFYFKSGWLSKVGERKGDRWRVRWFTLYNHHLTYSENQFSAYPNGQLKLNSDQKGYGVGFSTSVFHMVPPPTRHTFCLRTPTRRYYMCALTERDQKEWFEVISRVIALAYVLK